jgi:glycerol-3-phosphate acyltransferase PlsY
VGSVSAIVVAYLVGSVNFGVIVPRLRGTDIYSEGSGNPGATNVFRTLGKRAGALVMVGDVAKGVVAAAIGGLLAGEAVGFSCAFAAVVGHVFPVWHRFRGGRGVATALGAALWLEPVWGLVLNAGWGSVVAVTKTASVASLVAMVLYVPGYALFGHRGASLWWAAATTLLVVVRHAPNIRRIVTGSERRVVPE